MEKDGDPKEEDIAFLVEWHKQREEIPKKVVEAIREEHSRNVTPKLKKLARLMAESWQRIGLSLPRKGDAL